MRRQWALLAAAFLAATLAAAPAFGKSGPAAPSAASVAALSPIKHVIFVYRENHSFDNIFGPYCVNQRARACDGNTGPVRFSDGTTHPTQPANDIVPGVCHTVRC